VTDYYAFGLEMPGRTNNSDQYRYGFNGMEKDDEGEFGSQTTYTTTYRQYNPALGRFLSMDPEAASFVDQSPYNFSLNTPISLNDPEGDCPTKDCDEVKGMNDATYSIPSGSGTFNENGQLESFESEGTKYSYNGNGYSASLLGREFHYDATPEKSEGRVFYKTRGNDVRTVGDRPWLKYISPSGVVNSDDIGWGESGSAESVVTSGGKNWRGLLDGISERHTRRSGIYGHGDPQEYAATALKEVVVTMAGGKALGMAGALISRNSDAFRGTSHLYVIWDSSAKTVYKFGISSVPLATRNGLLTSLRMRYQVTKLNALAKFRGQGTPFSGQVFGIYKNRGQAKFWESYFTTVYRHFGPTGRIPHGMSRPKGDLF